MSTETISEVLQRGADDAVAICAPDGIKGLRYRDLRALVERTVADLNSFGVGRGDRVAMVLPNGPEAATAFVALAAGATLAIFAVMANGTTFLIPQSALNGSVAYLPPLAALLVIGWLVRGAPTGRRVLQAGCAFAVSLVLRSIDRLVCPAFPLGAHFAWHLLNGFVLYLLITAAIEATPVRGCVRAN